MKFHLVSSFPEVAAQLPTNSFSTLHDARRFCSDNLAAEVSRFVSVKKVARVDRREQRAENVMLQKTGYGLIEK